MRNPSNPYAPPKHDEPAPSSAAGASPELEAIRREHINAETNVKTIGALLYLGAVILVLTGVATFTEDPGDALINIVMGGAAGFGGYWLRRLDARGRTVYTAIAGFAILVILYDVFVVSNRFDGGVTLGRLFWPALFLALLWVRKASTVMTPHYRDVVIPATPHVKRKTSIVVIVIGVLLLLLVVAGVLAGLLD